MRYAIELYFDKDTTDSLSSLAKKLAKKTANTTYLGWNTPPHISIGVFNDVEIDQCSKLLRDFCGNHRVVPIEMSSVGIFNNTGCVFAMPVITAELLTLHSDLHSVFSCCDHSGSEYYLPGTWVPHCALFLGSGDKKGLVSATEYMIKHFKPLAGTVEKIALIELTKPVNEISICGFGAEQ